jgi:hypothetical protein
MKCIFIFILFLSLSSGVNAKVVHVFVALCDNINQGIVPVPAKIGNGQDPNNNLYWGCGFGVRTFFKKDADWILLEQKQNPQIGILERCVFKHAKSGTMLVADAYDGALIKTCIDDFMLACSGKLSRSITIGNLTIEAGGSADLICYTGHDGLMEFSLDESKYSAPAAPKSTIVLACISKSYFSTYLKKTNSNPLVWTSGLMAPEAYTLEAAVEAWIANKSSEEVRSAAAAAYSKYQKCSLNAARKLLVTGF